MRFVQNISLLWLVTLFFIGVEIPFPCSAQVTINTLQQVNFGTIVAGRSGGTVTISPNGVRTVVGDIIDLKQGEANFNPLEIEVEAPIGSRLTLIQSTQYAISNSRGNNMYVHVLGSYPIMPFTTTAPKTIFKIGAVLTIRNGGQASTAGQYNGSLQVNILTE